VAAGAQRRLSTTPTSAERVAALDGVRGLAVLTVVIHNSAWIAGESRHFVLKIFNAATATGWIGVQLFFVLSGFLITGILLDSKGKPTYFRSFYIRRILRIFPLYYVVVALTILVAPRLSWSPAWAAAVREGHPWAYWLYVQNWVTSSHGIDALSHTWSLAVEEQFYLLWPVIVWCFTRRALSRLCVAALVGTPFIRLGLRLAGLGPNPAYVFTIARWDALAAGALVAILVRDDHGRRALDRWRGGVTGLAGIGLVVLTVAERGFHSFELWVQVIGQSLVAVLSATLIAYAVDEDAGAPARLQAWLSKGWLRSAGKYSYAMYLFHQPIQQFLTPIFGEAVRGPDTPWRLARLAAYLLLVLSLTFLAALCSWRIIEKPCLELKERIAPRVT